MVGDGWLGICFGSDVYALNPDAIADERLRRCLQHGYRVLSVDDRTGAQW